MDSQLSRKYDALRAQLSAYPSLGIAFSGGVDSQLLLYAAHRELGESAVALTATSPVFPAREHAEAVAFCQERGIRQVVFAAGQMELPAFRRNPEDRCYHCKHLLLGTLCAQAREAGLAAVAEGSNLDDRGDYRPGARAVAELGVASPLQAAGLTKADIRALAHELGLPAWNKPSFACLASRFAYGQPITEAGLARIDAAEQFLLDRGFTQVRVRVHGQEGESLLARIELPEADFARFFGEGHAAATDEALRALGFSYVAFDLGGYRTGKMNGTRRDLN